VQIRGVPPKWSKWSMFRQIASAMGKLLEGGASGVCLGR
jgi:hypothetical protein